jgi:hypothetical protein
MGVVQLCKKTERTFFQNQVPVFILGSNLFDSPYYASVILAMQCQFWIPCSCHHSLLQSEVGKRKVSQLLQQYADLASIYVFVRGSVKRREGFSQLSVIHVEYLDSYAKFASIGRSIHCLPPALGGLANKRKSKMDSSQHIVR